MSTNSTTPVPEYTEGANWRDLGAELTPRQIAWLERFETAGETTRELYYIAASDVNGARESAALEAEYLRATGSPVLGVERSEWFGPDEEHASSYRHVYLTTPFATRGINRDGELRAMLLVDVEVSSKVSNRRIHVSVGDGEVDLSAASARFAASALCMLADELDKENVR